jgi:hypothetical protein
MRVWLVGTFHEARGHTNIASLVAILERIGPEVIFLECPPAVFHEVLDGTRRNVEFDAARSYSARNDVSLVPVDLPTPPESFFRDTADLFERIESVSSDYRQLIDRNGLELAAHGFAYLNSERCDTLWAAVYEAIRVTVAHLADRRLTELHNSWTTTHHLRDEAMLQGIADYAMSSPSETGVLLVGAAHRRTILDKSRKSQTGAAPRIEWDLSDFLQTSG